jgi:hypothetical protein
MGKDNYFREMRIDRRDMDSVVAIQEHEDVNEYSTQKLFYFVKESHRVIKKYKQSDTVANFHNIRNLANACESALERLESEDIPENVSKIEMEYDISNAASFFYHRMHELIRRKKRIKNRLPAILENGYRHNKKILDIARSGELGHRHIEEEFIIKSIQRAAYKRAQISKRQKEDTTTQLTWYTTAYAYSKEHIECVSFSSLDEETMKEIWFENYREGKYENFIDSKKSIGVFNSIRTLARSCKQLHKLTKDDTWAKKGYVLTNLFFDMYNSVFEKIINKKEDEFESAKKLFNYFIDDKIISKDDRIEIDNIMSMEFDGELKLL